MANLNIRLPDGITLEQIDEVAKKYDLNRTEFVLKALEMLLGFDDFFLAELSRWAEGLHLPEWIIIQNMVLARFAKQDASETVYEEKSPALDEFQYTTRNIITGRELYQRFYKDYVKRNAEKRLSEIRADYDDASEEDKLFMDWYFQTIKS